MAAEIPTHKRTRRSRGRLRLFANPEHLDITEVLQVATRYVAIPYLVAVALATLLSWSKGQIPWLGLVAVAGGGILIAAAELCRIWLIRRGRTIGAWLVLSVFLALHALVGFNASLSRGLDGGLWLSLTVLSTVGGTLLPMRLSLVNGWFGAAVLTVVAASHAQLDREHASTVVLGVAITVLGSPTASLFRDVIVREARRRLRQQVSQLELFNLTLTAVIQSMTEGLVTCDAMGRVELWNRRLELLTGYPDFEAEGRPVSEVLVLEGSDGPLSDEEHPCIKALEGPIYRGSVLEASPGEIRLVSASGEKIPVTIAAAPLVSGQDPAGVVALVVDVSRERELSQMRNSLVSMVSHELRTPLTMIVGFSELLLQGGFDEEQYKECASEILDAANRLSGLVDDLLSTAALERGSLELNRRSVALSALLDQSVASFLPESRERVESNIEETILFVDPDRIAQVLGNIIGNALKYSDPGTRVEVASRRLDGFVHIDITDHGYGVDDETLSNLFTMFTRSTDERVRKIPGTGLGLYIAKKLVEMHGGNIEVRSKKGEGSTFTVILPVDAPASPTTSTEVVG
jgi:PAS domain S-box-containing protein